MKSAKMLAILFLALGLIVCQAKVSEAAPMGTAFTYQGRLIDANDVADGEYDFQFKLFDDPNVVDGNQVGIDVNAPDVDVIDGYFTVALDFNDVGVFNGDARWLEIAVRPGASVDGNDFVTLIPRQETTPTPYALQTRGIFVDNVLNVGIGTTSPVGKLHVDGGKAMDGTLGADVVIKAQDGGDGWAMQNNGEAGGDIILLPGEGGEESGGGFPGPDGNVGIGTTEPGATLDIIGDLATRNPGSTPNGSQILLSSPQGNPGLTIQLGDGAGNRLNQWVTGVHSDESYYIQERGALGSQGTKHMVIASDGNVGIGTTEPARKLEVRNTEAIVRLTSDGSVGSRLELHNINEDPDTLGFINFSHYFSGVRGQIAYSWDGMDFKTASVQRMRIHKDGNVGIGTTSPETKLHIDGGSDASLGGGGFLVTGSESGTNMVIDDNEIIARNNGNPSKLYLNKGSGNVVVSVLEIIGGSDLAEPFEVAGAESIEPGMVVAIDSEHPGQLRIADKAYDRKVAGIVSGANGINPGMTMSQEGTVADGSLLVALTGRVYAWADASNGLIEPGDLLTTSDIPGHAMKVTDYSRAQGAILGKAMSSLDQGQGLVLVLVTLQ